MELLHVGLQEGLDDGVEVLVGVHADVRIHIRAAVQQRRDPDAEDALKLGRSAEAAAAEQRAGDTGREGVRRLRWERWERWERWMRWERWEGE